MRLKRMLINFLCDESGGEIVEYAMLAALIVVASITVIGAVGTKVLVRWNSLNTSM